MPCRLGHRLYKLWSPTKIFYIIISNTNNDLCRRMASSIQYKVNCGFARVAIRQFSETGKENGIVIKTSSKNYFLRYHHMVYKTRCLDIERAYSLVSAKI